MISAIHFLNDYCTFEDPNCVWVLTGISRAKDNVEGYHKYLQRLVLTKPEDILECVNRIKAETLKPNTTYRMYVSINSRDVVKTTFNFQKTLLEISYLLAKGNADALNQAKRLSSLWKNELAQNCNRGTKRVLVDLDTNDNASVRHVLEFIQSMPTQLIVSRPSLSGHHFILNACDTRGLVAFGKQNEYPLDIQRDSLLYVTSWMGGDFK